MICLHMHNNWLRKFELSSCIDAYNLLAMANAAVNFFAKLPLVDLQ